jgi:thiamine biosynthesis lipoprotein ApbE
MLACQQHFATLTESIPACLASLDPHLMTLPLTSVVLTLQEAVADLVFAVQADMIALFSASKLGAALAPAAYHPTDAAVHKLWAQCESILGRGDEVPPDYPVCAPSSLRYAVGAVGHATSS